MTIRSLSNRRLVFAFGAAVAVLLVVGALSYRGIVVSRESDRWVRHSHEVLESLDELLFAVASIESSSRGFVLTGEDSYLASDHANISSAEQHLAAVRKLTVDNPDQQRQVPALERLVAQKNPVRTGSHQSAPGQGIGGGIGCDSKRTGPAGHG
jgi:CHASE3 domain sensor protein